VRLGAGGGRGEVTALVAGEVVDAVAVGAELLQQLLGGGDAQPREVSRLERLHRQRSLVLHPLDARAGDLHPLQLGPRVGLRQGDAQMSGQPTHGQLGHQTIQLHVHDSLLRWVGMFTSATLRAQGAAPEVLRVFR